MPTYEYACEACGHKFEDFQSIKAKPTTDGTSQSGLMTDHFSEGGTSLSSPLWVGMWALVQAHHDLHGGKHHNRYEQPGQHVPPRGTLRDGDRDGHDTSGHRGCRHDHEQVGHPGHG